MSGKAADTPVGSDALLATFVAALDHDLRTPLQNLRMAVALLGSDSAGVPERFLAPLVRTSGRLEALLLTQVGALRDLVRAPDFARARIDALVDAAISRVRSERAAAIAVAIDDVGPVHVDSGLLTDAIAMLLEHALLRTPEGGDVAVRAVASATVGSIALSVSDGGPAVDAEARERLLAPIGRNTQALAIAVAQRIVERGGGSLAFGDDPGCGLTLTIQLPRASD